MQHLLLFIVALLIVGLAFTVVKWPGGVHMTFSQHVAGSRWSEIYYFLLFLITLPLLMWFLVSWFVPNKHLPTAFLWFGGVAVLFQILCTLVPETGGVKTIAHRLLTGISGAALLPLVAIIAMSTSFSNTIKALAWAGLAVMIALFSVALMNQKGLRWALLLQAGYYALFFAILLIATYA